MTSGRENASHERVVAANREFYNRVAQQYESVDSRRSSVGAFNWVADVIRPLVTRARSVSPEDRILLLDAGAGTGMVSRLAAENGATAISIDLSTRILSQQKITGAFPVCADCCRLPLPDACCSVVVAFATLHHIYRWTDFFSECARILKPGGQLYTDHDIEANFVRKFRIPLGLYRRIFDHKTGYQAVDQGIGQQLYELTEFHGDSGIDGKLVGPQLEAVGFGEISLQYHWCGMLPTWVGRVVDTVVPIFNRPGIAPALRILATKR